MARDLHRKGLFYNFAHNTSILGECIEPALPPMPASVALSTTSPRDVSPHRRQKTIIFLAERLYRIPGHKQVEVTDAEDSVLQSFLDTPTMTLPTIREKSGLADPDIKSAIRGLRQKYDGCFADAIDCPGRKGNGGYTVRVRRQG